MTPTAIGTLIRNERVKRHWTLQVLAARCRAVGCEVTPQAITEIELGRTAQPRIRLLHALATAFDLPIDDFAAAIYTPPKENGRRSTPAGGKQRRGKATAGIS